MEISALQSKVAPMIVTGNALGAHTNLKSTKWRSVLLAKIPMQAIAKALCGEESENSQEALHAACSKAVSHRPFK